MSVRRLPVAIQSETHSEHRAIVLDALACLLIQDHTQPGRWVPMRCDLGSAGILGRFVGLT